MIIIRIISCGIIKIIIIYILSKNLVMTKMRIMLNKHNFIQNDTQFKAPSTGKQPNSLLKSPHQTLYYGNK